MSEAIENESFAEPGKWAHALASMTGRMPPNRCHTVLGWGLLAVISYLTIDLAWALVSGLVTLISEIGIWAMVNTVMTITMLPILSSFTVYALLFALFAAWASFRTRQVNHRFHGRKPNHFLCKPYNIRSSHSQSPESNLGEDIADNMEVINFASPHIKTWGAFLVGASLLSVIIVHLTDQGNVVMSQDLKLEGAYILLGGATLLSVVAHLATGFCKALLSAQLRAYRAK